MKKLLFMSSVNLFCLLCLSWASFPHQAFSAEVITLKADLWCPYTCDPASGEPGYMVEIAREIFHEAGYEVNYKIDNWARVVDEVRSGQIDGLVGAARADAPGFVFTAEPFGRSQNFFWAMKDSSFHYTDHQSLKGKKVGVINSYTYGDEVDAYVKKKDPSFVVISGNDALEKIVKMISAHRLDAFVENPNVLAFALKNDPVMFHSLKAVSKNIADNQDLFIAFSPKGKNSKKYAELLSQGLPKLKKSGKLKAILARYKIKEWK